MKCMSLNELQQCLFTCYIFLAFREMVHLTAPLGDFKMKVSENCNYSLNQGNISVSVWPQRKFIICEGQHVYWMSAHTGRVLLSV